MAVKKVAEKLKKQIIEVAAKMLNSSSGEHIV